MKHRLLFLSAVYLAGVIAFNVFRYLQYTDSMENVQSYAHYYELHLPEETEPLLDINTASAAKFAALPGVSRPLAEKIVGYRKQNGDFTEISELSACMPELLLSKVSGLLCCVIPEKTEIPEISGTESTSSEIMTEIIMEVSETPEITELVTEIQEITEAETIPESEKVTEILFPLELNLASADELCAIPGIGAVTASAIVEYRDAIGGFLNCEQLLEVSGISDIRYAQIVPYVYLENEYYPEPEPIPEETEEQTMTEIFDILYDTEPAEILMINLNTASKEDLLMLPHCDEALAEEILVLRDRDIHIFHNILEITLAEHVTVAQFTEWEPFLAVDDDGNTELPYIPPGI